LSNDGGDLVKADVNSSSLQPLHSLPAPALLGLPLKLDDADADDEGLRRSRLGRAVAAGPGDVGVMA
jgi:hypothetical protein